ncbi:hypothetical protein PR048_020175 [Dryococelus australis]|uniref:Uncharacterized protein n=1 Tax=Dryococelus australis TaxID=614101 RepID=A0ABQ9H5P0_9NEOP|nr:hypothetical protein PR048_020175 [Dryococelus australis]
MIKTMLQVFLYFKVWQDKDGERQEIKAVMVADKSPKYVLDKELICFADKLNNKKVSRVQLFSQFYNRGPYGPYQKPGFN